MPKGDTNVMIAAARYVNAGQKSREKALEIRRQLSRERQQQQQHSQNDLQQQQQSSQSSEPRYEQPRGDAFGDVGYKHPMDRKRGPLADEI